MALDPTGRITRARAATYSASDRIFTLKPSTRQTQKRVPGGNSKISASDENASGPVAGQNKRRAVLKDVTNVLCENSYKSCMNAPKIQTRNCKQAVRGGVKKGSKVVPDILENVQQNVSEKNMAEETLGKEFVAASLEIQQSKDNVENKKIEENKGKEVLKSQEIMLSTKREENKPLLNIGSSTTENSLADLQPGGVISKKPADQHIISNKDFAKFHEDSEGGPNVINIDSDFKDPLMCSLYPPDIYKNFRASELIRRPSSTFMEILQRDITQSMRGILIDWLVECCTILVILHEWKEERFEEKEKNNHSFSQGRTSIWRTMLVCNQYRISDLPNPYIKTKGMPRVPTVLPQMKRQLARQTGSWE